MGNLETSGGGTWRSGDIVDYATKIVLAGPITATQTHRDAIASVMAATQQAEQLLSGSLLEDLTDPITGEVTPIYLVTDNGPGFQAAAFARFIASRPELTHIRTRKRSPRTKGVIERYHGAIKIDGLWRGLRLSSLTRASTYDPDGTPTTIATGTGSGASSDLGFAAGYTFPGGLFHYGARYYNPSTARWTQQDPLNQNTTLQQANRYVYAGGDSINGVDLTGTVNSRAGGGDPSEYVASPRKSLSACGKIGVGFHGLSALYGSAAIGGSLAGPEVAGPLGLLSAAHGLVGVGLDLVSEGGVC